MTKIFQITFYLDNYGKTSTIKTMYNENLISGYCFDFGYLFGDNKIVVLFSNKDIAFFQDYLYKKGHTGFYVTEIRNDGGWINPKFWDWKKGGSIAIHKDEIRIKTDEIIKRIENLEINLSNDDIKHHRIDDEFKHIVGLKNIKNDLKKFYNHLEVMLEELIKGYLIL